MNVKLSEILTDADLIGIEPYMKMNNINTEMEVQDLSLKQVSVIGLPIINNKYGYMPPCNICTETIRIFITRAAEKKLSVF